MDYRTETDLYFIAILVTENWMLFWIHVDIDTCFKLWKNTGSALYNEMFTMSWETKRERHIYLHSFVLT